MDFSSLKMSVLSSNFPIRRLSFLNVKSIILTLHTVSREDGHVRPAPCSENEMPHFLSAKGICIVPIKSSDRDSNCRTDTDELGPFREHEKPTPRRKQSFNKELHCPPVRSHRTAILTPVLVEEPTNPHSSSTWTSRTRC